MGFSKEQLSGLEQMISDRLYGYIGSLITNAGIGDYVIEAVFTDFCAEHYKAQGDILEDYEKLFARINKVVGHVELAASLYQGRLEKIRSKVKKQMEPPKSR